MKLPSKTKNTIIGAIVTAVVVGGAAIGAYSVITGSQESAEVAEVSTDDENSTKPAKSKKDKTQENSEAEASTEEEINVTEDEPATEKIEWDGYFNVEGIWIAMGSTIQDLIDQGAIIDIQPSFGTTTALVDHETGEEIEQDLMISPSLGENDNSSCIIDVYVRNKYDDLEQVLVPEGTYESGIRVINPYSYEVPATECVVSGIIDIYPFFKSTVGMDIVNSEVLDAYFGTPCRIDDDGYRAYDFGSFYITSGTITDVWLKLPGDESSIPEGVTAPSDELQFEVGDIPTTNHPILSYVKEGDTFAKDRAAMDLYSITIDDDTISFPFTVQDLLDRGYTAEEDILNMPLRPEKSNTIVFSKDGDVLFDLNVTNITGDMCTMREAVPSTLKMKDDIISGHTVSMFDGALVLGQSTEDDVHKALGAESGIDKTTNALQYTEALHDTHIVDCFGLYPLHYHYSDGVDISCDAENGNKITKFEIYRHLFPEGFTDITMHTEMPDLVSEYKAPDDLSDDPQAPVFEADGIVYSLPVPLCVLLDDGWALDDFTDADSPVKAHTEKVAGTISKGDYNLDVTVINCSDYCCPLKYALVCNIIEYHFDDDDPSCFVISGGISCKMTEDELKTTLEKNKIEYEYNESFETYGFSAARTSGDSIYDCEPNSSSDEIEISLEDGNIERVEIDIMMGMYDYLTAHE